MGKTVLLAGGGTAGHVSPLLAVAAELARRGHDAVALGTDSGLEADLVPRAGVAFRSIPKVPFPRRLNGAALLFPFRLIGALRATGRIVKEVRPDVVVGFGGFVATPAYLVARRRRIPVVVHEANAKAGMANRLGARCAATVAANYPGTRLQRRRRHRDAPARGDRVAGRGVPGPPEAPRSRASARAPRWDGRTTRAPSWSSAARWAPRGSTRWSPRRSPPSSGTVSTCST